MRKDKEATRAYNKQWYEKNKQRRIAINSAYRQRLGDRYQAYKQTLVCALCPENNACCLDFHHHNNDKEHNVSDMVHDTYSWDKVLKEIQKCVVLCKNCHAKVHAGHARVV